MNANKSSSKEIEYSSSLFEKMNLNTKYIQKPKTPVEKYVEFGGNCPA